MAVQTYEATHDGRGNPLPVLGRQFISFTWGDKKIEDFNLVVVFKNNRLEKKMYSSFVDATSSHEGVDGTYYWSTTMSGDTIGFSLATDGMTSKDYEEFKAWFRPGEIRKLVLTEYPFRYAWARISEPPSISMLPFEHEIVTPFGKSKTTLYKGDVSITFAIDDPYWYSSVDYFEESDLAAEEVVKDIYESGTPVPSRMGSTPYWLAGYKYFDGSSVISQPDYFPYVYSAAPYDGRCYYCGTAHGKPIVHLEMPVTVGDDGYIVLPYNTHAETKTNQISIGEKVFSFVLPPYLAAYNQAMEIVNGETGSYPEIKEQLREKCGNPTMRALAVREYDANGSLDNLKNQLPAKVKFVFNSKNGLVTVEYKDSTGTPLFCENGVSCVKSPYILMEDRNQPNAEYQIDDENLTHVTTNMPVNSVWFDYLYAYL